MSDERDYKSAKSANEDEMADVEAHRKIGKDDAATTEDEKKDDEVEAHMKNARM